MNNNTAQTADPDAIDAIEEQLDLYQSDTPWQTDLATQDLAGAGDHDLARRKLDAIVAELRRAQMRLWWLQDRMVEIYFPEGAQDNDRAVRRVTAISAEMDRVEARQTELEELRAAMEDEVAGCYEPNANYDPDDEAL